MRSLSGDLGGSVLLVSGDGVGSTLAGAAGGGDVDVGSGGGGFSLGWSGGIEADDSDRAKLCVLSYNNNFL